MSECVTAIATNAWIDFNEISQTGSTSQNLGHNLLPGKIALIV